MSICSNWTVNVKLSQSYRVTVWFIDGFLRELTTQTVIVVSQAKTTSHWKQPFTPYHWAEMKYYSRRPPVCPRMCYITWSHTKKRQQDNMMAQKWWKTACDKSTIRRWNAMCFDGRQPFQYINWKSEISRQMFLHLAVKRSSRLRLLPAVTQHIYSNKQIKHIPGVYLL